MALLLTLLGNCAFTSLPGPPSIEYQNGTYQLYPINRRECPGIDPLRDTIFELYTRKNPYNPQILLTNDTNSIQSSHINFSIPTVIFFHGFMESSKSDDAVQIRNGYLQKGNYNVILVNNKRLLAGPNYHIAVLNCKPIGEFTASFVDFLVPLGLKVSSLHIVGMSLGGQIAGLTGKFIRSGKVARITGLDPAGPEFINFPQTERIGPDDAEFVDIVHTNAGLFGINLKSGQVDIWFNGGSEQPGCSIADVIKRKPGSISELTFCNHYQAYRVYAQALFESTSYLITKCSSYDDYKEGKCSGEPTTYLGEDIDQSSQGNYYITTGETALDI